MDLSLILTMVLIIGAIAWNYLQMRALHRRLAVLERQYLALVADLEEKIYSG